jgi:starch synthase
MMEKQLTVLFLSPEAIPFAKTGGLADVAGSLSDALSRLGADVRLALPFYRMIRGGNFDVRPLLNDLTVRVGNEKLTANVFESKTKVGVPVYLIECDDLYDRPNLYGNSTGDYYDNLERFTFFSHAALILTELLNCRFDVIHCHDWQTGLVPALLKGAYKDQANLSGTASVFTIHNIGYQGIFSEDRFWITGLPRSEFFHSEGLEYWGKICLLKSGIVYSDAITTVSPNYARELQTSEYGRGMEGILQKRRSWLHGILNGVNYSLWNPAHDTCIASNYSPENMGGKSRCKKALIREMNLDITLESRPLLGIISRLEAQKGLDLLVEILDDILSLDVGLVVLGSGNGPIQTAIKEAYGRHPGRVGIYIGFNESLAHRILAGADMFLVPSRYEPCGLTQMYALKYGTVPVARATGGLEDTVAQFAPETNQGTGFKFGSYDPAAFLAAIKQAVAFYTVPDVWNQLIMNGMASDFSWNYSAKRYMDLYQSLL